MRADIKAGYQACLHGAAYYIIPENGHLKISGSDRIDFLQRQTTNDLRGFSSDQFITTVLTSPLARILDVLLLFSSDTESTDNEDKDGAVHAMTLPGRVTRTVQYLQARIFFMDKVTVLDLSQLYAQIDLVGPEVGAVLAGLEPEIQPESGRLYTSFFEGRKLIFLYLENRIGLGYRLLLPADLLKSFEQYLISAGSIAIDMDTYQVGRIERGIPGERGELIEAYTPLEVGYEGSISAEKGCYTGQEVIARQLTYNKVTKKLCGLKLESLVEPGSQLVVDSRPAGEITSIAESPRFGNIALALVKRPYNQVGTILDVSSRNTQEGIDFKHGIQAKVSSLPFSE